MMRIRIKCRPSLAGTMFVAESDLKLTGLYTTYTIRKVLKDKGELEICWTDQNDLIITRSTLIHINSYREQIKDGTWKVVGK